MLLTHVTMINPTVARCPLYACLLILLHEKPICKFPRKIGFTKNPLGLNHGCGSGRLWPGFLYESDPTEFRPNKCHSELFSFDINVNIVDIFNDILTLYQNFSVYCEFRGILNPDVQLGFRIWIRSFSQTGSGSASLGLKHTDETSPPRGTVKLLFYAHR